MQKSWVFILLILVGFSLKSQNDYVAGQYKKFSAFYNQGDLINAEQVLLEVLECKDSISQAYIVATYNNLGVVNNLLGRYDKALEFINQAESILVYQGGSVELADIYVNKARNYGIIKEYGKAIDFLNQALKFYQTQPKLNKSIYYKISTGYLNLGLTYYEKGEFSNALKYLHLSCNLKEKFSLSEKALVYLNLAKVYLKLYDNIDAEKFFLKSIDSFNREFGPDYYRITSVLFDYGLFLRSTGRKQESLQVHQRALEVCLKNYGAKHPFVSLAYKLLGDYYTEEKEYPKALEFYQKALVAVVRDFNDTNIFSNPTVGSAIFSYRLLDNLKGKAQAFALLAEQQQSSVKSLEFLEGGYQTINLALEVIEKIRSEYLSVESKLYLAQNEKDTYLSAIEIASLMHALTGEQKYVERMYSISSLSKARVLTDEIADNELLYSKTTSDTILLRRNELLSQIYSYNKLIQDESQKTKPDSQKIELWKDKIFQLNRDSEQNYGDIRSLSSLFNEQVIKSKPLEFSEIKRKLSSTETIVEYFIPHRYNNGMRDFYIFTLNRKGIKYVKVQVDSLFTNNVGAIKQAAVKADFSQSTDVYNSYINALAYMYQNLVSPIKENIAGSSLVIIPDEELSYLPFEAFIKELPQRKRFGFDGLKFLIFDYSIAYSYSTSFYYSGGKKGTNRLNSFIPDYTTASFASNSLANLLGAKTETRGANNFFVGTEYSGGKATESAFKSTLTQNSILHLAMHSATDTLDSKFSYLIFDNNKDSVDDGRLYNYEISMNRVESPMVVLSACNTGTGTLYHGEGIMSLGRSFFLAGASSVVNTLWDVNDEASSFIMAEFYWNLSMGMTKDEAMRLAKLKYLENSTPTYSNPYFWASYQVLGDKLPIHGTPYRKLWYIAIAVIAAGIFLLYRYTRKRNTQ